MSGWLDLFRKAAERRRVVEIGWMIDAEKAGFIYDAPRFYQRNAPKSVSTKGVGLCPAVLDYESRIVEVPCPFDVHLRIGRDDKGNMQPFAVAWNPKGYINNAMHRIAVRAAA